MTNRCHHRLPTGKGKGILLFILLSQLLIPGSFPQTLRTIAQDELRDKIAGYWIGQLVGNYLGFPFEGTYAAPVSDVSALTNGLFGIMAILYGNGDFVQTTAIAVSAGLDCDNQAATCGGLIGVLTGAKAIPDRLTLGMSGTPVWKSPFNDTYINLTRDSLPGINRISDITERILHLAELAIIENGGSKFSEDGKTFYRIYSDL
jgi:hypothetical protein